jgi:hypothetical protein
VWVVFGMRESVFRENLIGGMSMFVFGIATVCDLI